MPPTAPPEELKALRDALTACDAEIVRALGERMRLVGEVARIKGKAGLPSFDREREGAHLDDLTAQATRGGVPVDVLRDVFGALFAASRRSQRATLIANADRFTIGIVGGAQGMGAFLARTFEAGGFDVEVNGLEVGRPSAELAALHDLVIVAVPIASTVRVIREIAPHVRKGACLCDITSVKANPLAAMMESAPDGVDVVGTHPMFGPSGVDFDRQKVVLCKGRGDAGFLRVKKLFELFGAEIIEAEANEHDAQMALIQVLVHEKTMVLGSVLERLKANLGRSLDFASPIYRTELAMIGRMFSQGAELYADILTSNSDAARLSHLFEQEAAYFARAVAMSDRDSVVKRFREVAAFMSEFAAWAKKESDAILHDLVRHG